jgi:hypothetical protein
MIVVKGRNMQLFLNKKLRVFGGIDGLFLNFRVQV